MQFDFTGKTALVTGAGSGIGAAIAADLARFGAHVILADIDDEGAAGVLEDIVTAGGAADIVHTDTSDPVQVERTIQAAVKQTGGLHFLVNNAGIGGPAADTGSYPLDGWHKVIDVNLHGVFYGMRYGLPAIEASGGGAIVNISSILGTVAFATASAYVAAKHGVVGLTKAAAVEYAARGVRVNAIGPAFIRTPLLSKHLDEPTLEGIAQMHPVKRLGTAAEVSALTCFLLSPQASFITGSYHLVDGGYTAV